MVEVVHFVRLIVVQFDVEVVVGRLVEVVQLVFLMLKVTDLKFGLDQIGVLAGILCAIVQVVEQSGAVDRHRGVNRIVEVSRLHRVSVIVLDVEHIFQLGELPPVVNGSKRQTKADHNNQEDEQSGGITR